MYKSIISVFTKKNLLKKKQAIETPFGNDYRNGYRKHWINEL